MKQFKFRKESDGIVTYWQDALHGVNAVVKSNERGSTVNFYGRVNVMCTTKERFHQAIGVESVWLKKLAYNHGVYGRVSVGAIMK